MPLLATPLSSAGLNPSRDGPCKVGTHEGRPATVLAACTLAAPANNLKRASLRRRQRGRKHCDLSRWGGESFFQHLRTTHACRRWREILESARLRNRRSRADRKLRHRSIPGKNEVFPPANLERDRMPPDHQSCHP